MRVSLLVYNILILMHLFRSAYSVCHDTFLKINNRRVLMIRASSSSSAIEENIDNPFQDLVDVNYLFDGGNYSHKLNDNITQQTLLGSDGWNQTTLLIFNGTLNDCGFKCKNRVACFAFNYNINERFCELIEYPSLQNSPFGNESTEAVNGHGLTNFQIANDPNSHYLEKTCLRGSNKCDAPYAFDMILHMELDGHDDRIIANITKDECLEACLMETQFQCRSIDYNYYNFTCSLSRSSKLSKSGSLIKSPGKDYFENMCHSQEATKYCKYTKYEDNMLVPLNNAIVKMSSNPKRCMDLCTRAYEFPCKSINYNKENKECHLSNEGSSNLNETRKGEYKRYATLVNNSLWDHYQKGQCLNAKLECKSNEIRIVFKSNQKFSGVIYALKSFRLCHKIINGRFDFDFSIPIRQLNSDFKEFHFENGWDECRSIYEKLPDEKHRFKNYIYIQKHKMLQTIKDFLIPVVCTYTSQVSVESNNIVLRV